MRHAQLPPSGDAVRDPALPPAWAGYLQGLDALVGQARDALVEGAAPVLTELAPPLGAPPPALLARRNALLAELQEVVERLERRRDEMREQLATLAPPRPRGQAEADSGVGAALDLVG